MNPSPSSSLHPSGISVKEPQVPENATITVSLNSPNSVCCVSTVKVPDAGMVTVYQTSAENSSWQVGSIPAVVVADMIVPTTAFSSNSLPATKATAPSQSSFAGAAGADSVVKLNSVQPTACPAIFLGIIFQ